MDGFNEEMKVQRERARAARSESTYMGTDVKVIDTIPSEIETKFDGYKNLELQSKIKVIIKNDDFADCIKAGEKGLIVTDKTPFYAEMGGQIGDKGTISADGFVAKVENCKNNIGGKIIHFVEVKIGRASCRERV